MGVSTRRLLATIPLAAAVIAYIIAVENGLREQIEAAAPDFGVELVYSWIWLWDFAVMTAFVSVALAIYFGKKWVRIAPAGPIFLGGSAAILSLDAFFPYDSLGPLQFFVPYLVELNVWLIGLFDLGMATANDNLMFLRGDHGAFALQVFWPSAGVHSIIIYSLVMMAFLLKMNVPRGRKAAWFAIGIIGTIAVNVARIFALSWYALKVTTDAAKWEEFHSVAGEIMFLPWLFAFLVIVMVVESRRLTRLKAQSQK
ncbi:multitransmembrane protein [Cenarchaeum symbiosum A]|uniref:Multitransmembrane protein n=1 Tax=Cenarchaeum symbiosum (strain A) TaxID=414004 RepID=A0RUK6_CENSY|nr:multitransmembrane protein [Cenarchaeum symbiosum A]